MKTLNISIVGNFGNDQKEIESAKFDVERSLPDANLKWVTENPEVIFFASGGSEDKAKDYLKGRNYIILLANEKNNSYAAATEVKAYADKHHIATHLLNLNDKKSIQYFKEYGKLKTVIKNLKGKRIGLIGNVSPWLIASGMKTDHLKDRFGIEISQIDWEALPNYKDMDINEEFNAVFSVRDSGNDSGNISEKLDDSSRVYQVLKKTISDKNFDAISTECFPLVREHKVTACLALAKLNEEGIPAGCEGDIPSAVGLILSEELTGTVPWMANTASITSEKTLFAHCTIAPKLIDNMDLPTHYETDEGLAVRGDFISDNITVFRFNDTFSKIFISEGEIIARPKYNTACRTQIEVKLPKKSILKLQEKPLGNHHIIIPGNWKQQLKTICKIKGIKII